MTPIMILINMVMIMLTTVSWRRWFNPMPVHMPFVLDEVALGQVFISVRLCFLLFLWTRAPQQMLRTHRSLKAYCATLWWRSVFSFFPSNGEPVEWNWQGKTEVLGGKPVLVPLCQPHIDWPGIKPGPPRREAGDWPPEPWHGQYSDANLLL
jgi:hypothetical protein